GRLAGVKNKRCLIRCLMAGVCANEIRTNPNRATRGSADSGSASGAHCCACGSRQSAQQGADAYADGGSQGGLRLLGIDLELPPVVTMDHRRSVHGDVSFVVQLPERVQALVSLACAVKDHSDVVAHEILLF